MYSMINSSCSNNYSNKQNRIISITDTPLNNPVVEVLTVQEVKDWLIVGHSQDDAIIARLIKAVRRMCEKRTKRHFIPTTVVVTANVYRPFVLPRLPVVSVTSAGNWNRDTAVFDPLAVGAYYLEGEAFVVKQYTYDSRYQVQYVAGYADGEVPEDIIQAMFHEIAYRYENRGNLNVKPGLHETTTQMLLPYTNTRYSI
jgi:uncharacterized phiE125 gp8 family phage protein